MKLTNPISPSDALTQAAPPVVELFERFGLADWQRLPTASELNQLCCDWHTQYATAKPLYRFAANHEFADDTRYYESIIAEERAVPTRNNWHDVFNALIWTQFPSTKAHLNALHRQDIATFGLNPRTPRRNRITHFDECGLVLAVRSNELELANELLDALSRHQWEDTLFERRAEWEACIVPHLFGHANLEMLLSPFVGLTAKWLAVVVPEHYDEMSPGQQVACVDSALLERVKQLGNFELAQQLRPLPLLGIPRWHPQQDAAFYRNEHHFRRQRENTPACQQLPLGKS